MPSSLAVDRAERVRRLLAPLVAVFATGLALCCLVTVPDVIAGWPRLGAEEPRLAGWAGLAVVVAVAAAALALLCCSRLGSGPPLTLGVIAAIGGLAISRDITSEGQLVLAVLTLAIAVGSLSAAGLCVVEELPSRWARTAFVARGLPLAGGWAVLGWVSLHTRARNEVSFGVHPPLWAVGAAIVLALGWAILTILLEPDRPLNPSAVGWEGAWVGLGVLLVGAGTLVMLVGFQPDLSASWVRPVVLLVSALAVIGLVGCGWLMPMPSVRASYVAVVVTLLCGPSCLHLQLTYSSASSAADQALSPAPSSALSWWLLALLLGAGLVGCGLGWRYARIAGSGGLLVMALAAAGGWVMPSNQWLMAAAAVPFAAGVAAACMAGLRLSAATRMSVRYVSLAGLTALLFGLLSAAPLAWALGAEVTGPATDTRAGGRVLLGLTFALTVLASAGVWVLMRRRSTAAERQDDPPVSRPATLATRINESPR